MERDITYFVTGASGFIGRHLIEELSREGLRMRCLVRRRKHLGLWPRPNVAAMLGDLLDKESLANAIGDAAVCIHLASIINSRNDAEFEMVNIEGMSNLIDACIKKGVRKIIYTSSIDAKVNPDSLYGRTKLAAEDRLKHSGIDYTILRPAVVYGELDRKNIASLINMARILPVVPVLGNGDYKRQPVYVADLVDAIKKCINLEVSNFKTYNVGGPEAISMNDIIKAILNILGKEKRLVHLPLNTVRAACIIFGRFSLELQAHMQQILSIEKDKLFDIGLTRIELGFEPVAFTEGLAKMFERMAVK